MKPTFQSLLALILSLFLLFCFSFEVRTEVPYQIPVTFTASLIIFVVTILSPRVGLWVICLSILTLPFFGSGVLNFCASAWLFAWQLRHLFSPSVRANANPWLVRGIVLFLFSAFLSLEYALLLEFDWRLFVDYYKRQELFSWYLYQREQFDVWLSAVLRFAQALMAASFLRIALIEREREYYWRSSLGGFAAGAIICSIVSLGQLLKLHPYFSIPVSAFWQFAERWGGTLGDPNAFAMTGALLLPLLLGQFAAMKSRFALLSSVALLLALPWTGSRSLYLGLVVTLLFYLLRQSKKVRTLGVAASLSLVALFFFLVLSPTSNDSLQQRVSSPAAKRILQTLHADSAGEMLLSRSMFSKVAMATFFSRPVLGVGLGRFYQYQDSVADSQNVELGEWRDNANNFYFHILAERGFVGASFILVAFIYFYLGVGRGYLYLETDSKLLRPTVLVKVAQCSFFSFLLLLFTGPHLHFTPVLLLFVFTLACGQMFIPRAERGILFEVFGFDGILIVTAVFATAMLIVTKDNSMKDPLDGFHRVEQIEGQSAAWSTSKARVSVCLLPSPKSVRFALQAPRPDITSNPISVELSVDGTFFQTLRLDSMSRYDVTIPGERFNSDAAGRSQISLAVSSLWKPAGQSGEGDTRLLGVLVFLPEELCQGNKQLNHEQ